MLTVKEVSKELGVSLALVYREIQAGRLHVHRFGKRTYRISRSDLEAYVDGSKQPFVEGPKNAISEETVTKSSSKSEFKHIDVSRLLSERN